MAQLFNISNWSEQRWWNTGGTRNKKVFLNPEDNIQYYFKQSLKREGRDYKYEFWSEILASEIGTMCGFNVLPYHVAICDNEVGCLSKSMIIQGEEELVEGGKYLQAFDNTFNPDDRGLRHQYDFDLIIDALEKFSPLMPKGRDYKKDIIEIIVFDALIGNSDRHQENWAFITEHSVLSQKFADMERNLEHANLENISKWLRSFIKAIYYRKGTQKMKPEYQTVKLSMAKSASFAPIYDSGCSFGRELSDDKVSQLLANPEQIESYVKRGESEIHWKNEKVSHFVFLEKLLQEGDFEKLVKHTIKRIVEKFNEQELNELITKIDVDLPVEFSVIRIPDERKQLIYKLVISRFNLLKALVQEVN